MTNHTPPPNGGTARFLLATRTAALLFMIYAIVSQLEGRFEEPVPIAYMGGALMLVLFASPSGIERLEAILPDIVSAIFKRPKQ